jgi:hypothetical protein
MAAGPCVLHGHAALEALSSACASVRACMSALPLGRTRACAGSLHLAMARTKGMQRAEQEGRRMVRCRTCGTISVLATLGESRCAVWFSWQSEEAAQCRGRIHTQIIGEPESFFGRVPAALRTFGGGEVTVNPQGFVICINSYGCAVRLPSAMQLASKVCSAFADAEALYVRFGHSPEQLQPLLDMRRTFEMHSEVLRRFWAFHSLPSEVRWAMLPAEAREPFGSIRWSAWDYDDSDFDF